MASRLPEGLLEVAQGLVHEPHTKVGRACLRRAVSAAYYALFHLLVDAAVERMFVNDPQRREFGPWAARGFTHQGVKSVADKAREEPNQRPRELDLLLGGLRLTPELALVCDVFVTARAARETADYDLAAKHRQSTVRPLLHQVRAAFAAWQVVSGTDEGTRFAIALSLLARTRK